MEQYSKVSVIFVVFALALEVEVGGVLVVLCLSLLGRISN
jgi:hypothetical protein